MASASFLKNLLAYIDKCYFESGKPTLEERFGSQYVDFDVLLQDLIDLASDLFPEKVNKTISDFEKSPPPCSTFEDPDTLFAGIFIYLVKPTEPQKLLEAYKNNLNFLTRQRNVVTSFAVFLFTLGAIDKDKINEINTTEDVDKILPNLLITKIRDNVINSNYTIHLPVPPPISIPFIKSFVSSLLEHCKRTLKDQYNFLRENISDIVEQISYEPEDEDRAINFVDKIDCELAFHNLIGLKGVTLEKSFASTAEKILECIDQSAGNEQLFNRCLSGVPAPAPPPEEVAKKKQEEERKRAVADTLYTYILSQLGLENLPESEVYDLVKTVFENYKKVKDKMSLQEYIKRISAFTAVAEVLQVPEQLKQLITTFTTLAEKLPKESLDALQTLANILLKKEESAKYYINLFTRLADSIGSGDIQGLDELLTKFQEATESQKARDYLDAFISSLAKVLSPAPPSPPPPPAPSTTVLTIQKLKNIIRDDLKRLFGPKFTDHYLIFPIIPYGDKYYTFLATPNIDIAKNPDGTYKLLKLEVPPNAPKHDVAAINIGRRYASKEGALSPIYTIKFFSDGTGQIVFYDPVNLFTLDKPAAYFYLKPPHTIMYDILIAMGVIRGTNIISGSNELVLMSHVTQGSRPDAALLVKPDDITGMTLKDIISYINDKMLPEFQLIQGFKYRYIGEYVRLTY